MYHSIKIRGKHEDLGHTVPVYGLIRVLVFLLVDETMQYRPICRYCIAIHPIMISQNQRVSLFIEIFKGKHGDTGYYGVPKGSKSTEVVDHSVYAYFDIHVHV